MKLDLKNVLYTAYFVDSPEKLLTMFPPKHKNIYAHHSTIWYKPQSLENLEVGKKIRLKIIGRVFDEKGDAILVENHKSKKKYPHITISCANRIAPAYSDHLIEFGLQNGTIDVFPEATYIEVTEGYVDYKKNKHIA